MSLAYALLATWLLSGVVELTLWVLLLRRLRHSHPDLWLALGSPTAILNNSPSNGIRLLRFTWTREYLDAQDPTINRLVLLRRVSSAIYVASFAIVLGAFVVGVVQAAAA